MGTPHEIRPEGIPLGVRLEVPQDWQRAEIPNEKPDFSNPAMFHPLALFAAPYAAVIFVISARPGYDDGTLMDWMTYLAQQQPWQVTGLMPEKISGRWAAVCSATQAAEEGGVGPVTVRCALLEDAGNAVMLMGLAPEALWPAVGPAIETMLKSCSLIDPAAPTILVAKDFPM